MASFLRKIANQSLQRRLGIFSLAILVPVLLSAVFTLWMRSVQQQDALLLELAGRQRLRVEHLADELDELQQEKGYEAVHVEELQQIAETFEQTLYAMINGGQTPYLPDDAAWLPAPQDPDAASRLHQLHHTWDDYRGYLDVMLASGPGDPEFATAVTRLENMQSKLLADSEAVLERYQAIADADAARLWWTQGLFLAVMVVLMGGTYVFTRKTLLSPLNLLQSVTERLGRGDLNTPVEITGPREIEAIALSLDTLRAQLKNSQDEMDRRARRLEGDVARRQHQFVTAFELSQDIASDLELEALVESVTERARTLLRVDTARLCLTISDGSEMTLAGQSTTEPVPIALQDVEPQALPVQLLGPDDELLRELACANCGAACIAGPGQCVAAPLRTGDRLFGALCVVRSGPRPFDDDELRALSLLANSAAIAIANAILVETGRRQAEELSSLAERERLAVNLHDNLAQSLSVLNFRVDRLRQTLTAQPDSETAAEIERMQGILDDAYQQVRSTLIELRQPVGQAQLKTSSPATNQPALAEELAVYLDRFREVHGLATELKVTTTPDLVLAPSVQQQALNIVGEALSNARRHAEAHRVSVCVERAADRDEVRLIIEDDGRGFDPDTAGGEGHFGLTIMHARALRCGGQLTVDSAPNAGTRVVATFPLGQN